jgi:4a-hydroxytetrahydrobiopterin dehydratase
MPAMPKLSESEITSALQGLPDWSRAGEEISKTFDCASFAAAIAFVVRIGFLAEAANHHPDVDLRWKRVRIALTTHDSGGLTANDIDLARKIEEVAA